MGSSARNDGGPTAAVGLTATMRELLEVSAAVDDPGALAELDHRLRRALEWFASYATGGHRPPAHRHGEDPEPQSGLHVAWRRSSPVAPDLELHAADGLMRGTVRFTGLYEGPPGRAHGGYIAAAFDHAFGVYLAAMNRTSFTVRLVLSFHRAVPTDAPARIEVGLDMVDGRKSTVWGRMWADDELCVEATSLFLTPREAIGGS